MSQRGAFADAGPMVSLPGTVAQRSGANWWERGMLAKIDRSRQRNIRMPRFVEDASICIRS